jgi:dienelactone hydrolase
MRRMLIALALALLAASAYAAPPLTDHVAAALDAELQPRAVATHQLTRYLAGRVARLRVPAADAEWSREAGRLRRTLLDEVVFHGWPREWVTAPPVVEDLGVVTATSRYRIRKLRYEIVPGLRAPALLCEPVQARGAAPGVLNLMGHEEDGKAAAHAQHRCVAFAKMGIVALTPEWPGFGELAQPHNAHDFAAHLDLAGANALGFFYLAMRRPLDHLAQLPHVDRRRLGVTGLSGGGWQSVVLGALDERVAVAVEVAGVGSLDTTLTHPSETDEIEENATDFARTTDYPHLVALRAPRPTLLIHNVNDECCFRAALVKPFIHDAVKPWFALYGKAANLGWHENVEPGTHNYERDNRRAAYRFFAQHFGLPTPDDIAVGAGELMDVNALRVGVPGTNLTILGVAKTLAARVRRPPAAAGSAERAKLIDVVRYRRSSLARAWPMWSGRGEAATTLSYRLELDSGLGATAVWLRPTAAREDAPVTIVLNDDGRAGAADLVTAALARGGQVIAVDLLFFGDMVPEQPVSPGAELGVEATARPQKTGANFQMLLSTVGERPLGIQASQLLAVARWAQTMAGTQDVRVETRGIRSQIVALVAAALEPGGFAGVTSRQAVPSLRHLLDAPVTFRAAPELFCLDLYKEFEIERLTALAEPTPIRHEGGRP